MARRFPRSPGMPSKPFDGGPNPFADGQTTPTPRGGDETGGNLFAGSNTEKPQAVEPVEFVRTLPNRSRRVLMLGTASAILGAISLGMLLVANFVGDLLEGWFYCLPTTLLAMTLGIPACTLGGSDSRAIRAGVMEEQGRLATRVGWWLGVLGLAMGGLLVSGYVAFELVTALGAL